MSAVSRFSSTLQHVPIEESRTDWITPHDRMKADLPSLCRFPNFVNRSACNDCSLADPGMEHTGPEVVTLRKLIPLFIKPLASQGELRMSTSLSPSVTQMYKNRHSGHVVQFYTDHDALLDSLSRFIGSALVAGEAAVVLATEAHREGLAQRLKTRGIDTATAIQQGRYVPLDAARYSQRLRRTAHQT